MTIIDPKHPCKQRYTGFEPSSIKPENRLFPRVGQDAAKFSYRMKWPKMTPFQTKMEKYQTFILK